MTESMKSMVETKAVVVDGVETISVSDVEMFIIPNHASKYGSEYLLSSCKEDMNKLASLNGIELTEDSMLVQVWMTSDQLASDNLGSHGFRFINKNGELCLCKSYSKSLNMIPADLLKDLKEGDSVDILLPVYCESIESIYDDSKNKDGMYQAVLNAHITAAQKKYRYRRFGNFEDVLIHVTL